MNELIFLGYILAVSSAALLALRFGKEGLIGLICVQAVLVNLFVTKQISLFGFTATASDAMAVGITLTLNILQEYFQKATALKAIWISFFVPSFIPSGGLHTSFQTTNLYSPSSEKFFSRTIYLKSSTQGLK